LDAVVPHLARMPPVPSFRSSGDLLADRRYTYGRDSFEEGDFRTAADLAYQALELAPAFAAAHALLGRALSKLGDSDGAVAALQASLAADPEDALGVRIDLARLGALPQHEAIGQGYVRALFDDYAPQFERHLIKNLSYRGPQLIAEALRWAAARRERSFRYDLALDLGCGTGLMAGALEGDFGTIEGVDLSPRMLSAARKTKLYAALHQADLVAFLKGRPAGGADLVVAADVFVYMASLDEVFAEAHRVLRRRGFFGFTVQAQEGDGCVLGEDARYAHGERYLRDLAETTGFATVTFERVSTRQDRGEDVPGFLVILER
jgi:predicted TPR repeat methyltransferase